MNDEDILILDQQTIETLAEWWGTLNRWDWPKELPNPENDEYTPDGRRSQIMNWILGKIGRKECLRDWNKDSMTTEEFESWYRFNA